MTTKINGTVRNTRLNAIRDAIDAGGAAGKLRIYDGSYTNSFQTPTNLLAELRFSYPCAANAASGVLTFSAITADASADMSGTASWCRILTSADVTVMDGEVGTSGKDYNLNTTTITLGVQVSCTSASLTEGNS